MTLKGGKRKVNKSLKSWVAFVKRVQKEEKLNYKEAIHRAKVRKDKGEKWMMKGGDGEEDVVEVEETPDSVEVDETATATMSAGRRRTRRRRGSSKKSRKTKRRRSRRH